MYEVQSGARYAKITISGSETVKFPCTYGVFGVKGDNITVKLSETATGDGVYNTADGGGYILIAHYAHLDKVYLVGSGEVIVWAGNSPLDNPLKKAMSGYTPVTVEPLTVNDNGVYTAPTGKAYSPVTVDVQEQPWQPLQDGYSNFWFELTEDTLSPWLNFSAKTNDATIDWGDGSGEVALDTLTPTHTYSKAGRYIVKVKGVTGIAAQNYLPYTNYANILQYIEFNSEITTIQGGTFRGAQSLKTIAFSNSLTTLGVATFAFCPNIKGKITVPSVNEIPSSLFMVDGSLNELEIPEGTTTIGATICYYCTALTKATIPSTVTSIGSSAFYSCVSLVEVHCKATTPSTLIGSSVFGGLPSNFIIYVPTGYGDTYKAAEGWSAYADHILEEGQTPNRAMLSKFENTKKFDDIEIEDKR